MTMKNTAHTRMGNQHRRDRAGLLLYLQKSTPTLKRRHVTVRVIVSFILVFTAYELLHDIKSVLKQEQEQEQFLVPERSLPTNTLTITEEEANPALEENESKITLEHAPTRELDVSEEANGLLRGGERQVATQEGEREHVSGGGPVPLQGSEGEQFGGHIYDETKVQDAAVFGINQTEKIPFKLEEKGNVSDEVHTPLQDVEIKQSGGHMHDETNDHNTVVFSKKQTEKVPSELAERKDVSEAVHTPLQGGENEQSGATHRGNNNTIICFISSIFGTSVDKADKPPEVENIFPNDTASDYDFLLFTNLENLTYPGYTNIILTDLPYRRFITQSRWGKFVGWRHKGLSHCGTVIYTDGYVKPQTKNGLAPFRLIAAQVAQSEAGLAQVTHDMNGKTISRILKKIVENKKDVAANTDASWKWFTEQPDFDNKLPYYTNKWFAYEPSNPRFQEASSFFWDRYSQELDSWRDQPLWSYTLHHFNITPAVLFEKEERRELFIETKATGFGGHIYDESNDHDAAMFSKNQTEKRAVQ
jgi:hypothetical protein